MGITGAEKTLFDRWSEGRGSFVKDSVVDARAFEMASPSVLFLLKEVNDPGPDGGGWDLREFLRDGARGIVPSAVELREVADSVVMDFRRLSRFREPPVSGPRGR